MNQFDAHIPVLYGSSHKNKQAHISQKQQYNIPDKIQQPKQIKKQTTQQIHPENNISYGDHVKLKQQYYDFFKDFVSDPQKYVPYMPSHQEFKRHKIKFLKGNQFHQDLQSYDQSYIRVKNTQKQGTIVIYTVIIAMFELEITLLNIDQNANKQENQIGKGKFGSVRIQSQNKRIFAVKRQMFKEKQFNMIANKYEINEAINQLAIYKICSLLKIGPAAETEIGFDIICYRDCIEFQIQYCIKIEYQDEIIVDQNKFERQIKQCLLTLHFYGIIHKDIKPANILFSITYNKYVFTDFGISHPIVEKIGYRSQTHCQGTMSFMSKQMVKIGKGKTGFVHLYGNDKHSLFAVLIKQMSYQNIESAIKQFNSKVIKQLNTKYQYEYLKLKYYCIKPDSKMEEVQSYWKYMNTSRRQQLIAIVDKSIEYHKIKSVYDYLSKSQEFKQCDLESLKIQSQSIKNIKIDPGKQITKLHLRNTLRIYGYSQQVKDMIIKLKLEQKYKSTLQIIEKSIHKKSEVNHRDSMFGNHVNYIKKLENQIKDCYQKKDYRGVFKKFMIILQYGNMKEQIQAIQRLKILDYQRQREEKIEQMIRVCNIDKRKQKLKEFEQFMEQIDQEMDRVIRVKDLGSEIADIFKSMGKYEKALEYYIKSINMKISFQGEQDPSVANIYNNVGIVYKDMGKYEKALQYYTKSANMYISFYGEEHPNIADTYHNIANLYLNEGQYEKALEYYTKSVYIDIKFSGEQHHFVVDTYNNIGNIYNSMGKYEKALEYYTKNLNMKISFYREQHPSVSETYNNMANVYNSMGKYEKALEYYIKSVNMYKQYYGDQHPSVANIFNNIATVYDSMGKYDLALKQYNNSVNMHISYYGEQHPSVADTYNNIAVVYKHMGKYEKALEYYIKSVNMKISFYGQQHPNIADAYHNIANVYNSVGKNEKALQYYTKSVNMHISYYGKQHPSVADTYNNIAIVYKNMVKYEKAKQYYNKSLNMKISFYGEQHPSVADTLNNMADIFYKMRNFEKAIQIYTKSLNMKISFSGEQHHSVADTLNNMGLVYNSMGKYEKALEYYNKNLNIKISLYGQQHPSVADTYNNIADVYQNTRKYEKALKYYNRSANMNISYYGEQHPNIALTYNNMAGVYNSMGKYDEALKYYNKSVNMHISYYGEQHRSVAAIYINISSNLFALTDLAQSHKYCNKGMGIRSKLSLMQYPQTTDCYHLLSNIFLKKKRYIKSLYYEYRALDTFLKFSDFGDRKSPKYLSPLAHIYYKMNRFIESYFFYRMSFQISVKYCHDNNVQESKHMMNEMEWSMPSLIHNYTTNIQFMNDISNKYSLLPKHKLIKVLLGRKWQLKFEQQHRSRRDRFQYLKCVIEIYLCYKYLGYQREQKKSEDQMKEELLRFEQSQQKSMFREFISEISVG